MNRYWVIAPLAADDEEFDRIWSLDLANSEISIGWGDLGDISLLSKEELRGVVEGKYAASAPNARAVFSSMLWKFYHEIQPGDVVVARKGRRVIAGIGEVSGAPYFSFNKDGRHSNFLPVRWRESPRDLALSKIVFAMQTLYEIEEPTFLEIVGKDLTTIPPPDGDVVDQAEFILEKYLQEFVVTNLAAIFGKKLRVYVDPKDGVSGEQYVTDVGKIDILAEEVATGDLVVIELKKGRESDKVVGQLLRYMGWISEHLARRTQKVRGLIVCKEPDSKLHYAVRMVRDVEVKYYKVEFSLLDKPYTSAGSC